MVFTEMDIYIDMIVQMISMIAYTTIIIRTTWIFVPNRFPKLPADKKWPSYVITFLYALVIVILLTSAGLYYFDASNDFGEEFKHLNKVIDEIEAHVNTTLNNLPEIESPKKQLEGLKNITEDVKNRVGFGVIEREEQVDKNNTMDLREMKKMYHNSYELCPGTIRDDDLSGQLFKLPGRIDCFKATSSDILKIFETANDIFMKIPSNKIAELEKEKRLVTNHMESTKDIFGEFVLSLKKLKIGFNQRKKESIEKEDSRNFILMLPFSFTIVFALLSIVTNIIWGKDIPRLISIIQCILFYILSIQVVIASTYIAYDITEDIFTQEPEYFKLFDFEIRSYDNKTITNIYKALLTCDQENSILFSAQKSGILISNYPTLLDLRDELLDTINFNLDLTEDDFCKLEHITKFKPFIKPLEVAIHELNNCTDEIEKKKPEYIKLVNWVDQYLGWWGEYLDNKDSVNNIARDVIDERMKETTRLVDEPISKINQNLANFEFKCKPLYDSLLNTYISSHQPIPSVNRDLFKISVMGCSTLCLVLYLLALGRRIQEILNSTSKKPEEGNENITKPEAPRSPKRL